MRANSDSWAPKARFTFAMTTASSTTPPDRKEVARGLGVLLDVGSVAEIRVPNTAGGGTVSGYFDDLDAIVAGAAALSGSAAGVYVTVNPVSRDLLARAANRTKRWAKHTTSDSDILHRNWLFVDIDPERPTGISSSEPEHQAALSLGRRIYRFLIEEMEMKSESVVLGDSGNGSHLLVRVDLPNDRESEKLIRRCLDSLSLLFDDDSVKIDTSVTNAARLVKVPGTLAAKGDSLSERPHRLAHLLEAPEQVRPVHREVLESLAELVPDKEINEVWPEGAAGPEMGRWIEWNGMSVTRTKPWNGGTVYELSECPWNREHLRTARIVVFPNGGISAGCFHRSCGDKSWRDLLETLDPAARESWNGSRTPQGSGNADPVADGPVQGTWRPFPLVTTEEVEVARRVSTFPGRFIEYAAKRTDAPIEFLEGVGIAILSVVVGRKAKLRLTTGAIVPVMWIMLVADSTRLRKSTAIDLGTDLIKASGLDVLSPDDFSPQRFVTLMSERNGRPTLFRRDEFGGFYEGLNKLEHQAGGKQVLIAFHDGRDYRRELQGHMGKDRETGEVIRKPEVIEVKEPFLSILAGTQRDLFLSLAPSGEIYSGFLPRFSYIVPKPQRQRRDVGLLDSEIDRLRGNLAAELQDLEKLSARDMYLADHVLQRWNQYGADLEDEAERAPQPTIAAPVFDRHSNMALRLALLFAYCDCETVTMQHMIAGIETAERLRVQSYELLSAIGPTREEKMLQRVTDLVGRKPGIMRRDIMSSLRLTARQMDDADKTLTQRGWIRADQVGRGTRYYPSQTQVACNA